MAKEYWEKLSRLVEELNLEAEMALAFQTRHFFSGAAIYINGTMCASWSPVGLAFRLPEAEVVKLIRSGRARPLQYFPNGRVKKGYALFEAPDLREQDQWKKYFIEAARLVANGSTDAFAPTPAKSSLS